jgi:hypothetical protein
LVASPIYQQPGSAAEISNFHVTYLLFLRFTGHDQELGRRVDNLDLSDNCGGIRGNEELAQVVDNQFITACANVGLSLRRAFHGQ